MHTGLSVRPLPSANGWEPGGMPHHSWQLASSRSPAYGPVTSVVFMFECDLQRATRAFIFLGQPQPLRASCAHAIASPPAAMLGLAAAWHGATAASALQRVRTRLSCPAMASFHAHVYAVREA